MRAKIDPQVGRIAPARQNAAKREEWVVRCQAAKSDGKREAGTGDCFLREAPIVEHRGNPGPLTKGCSESESGFGTRGWGGENPWAGTLRDTPISASLFGASIPTRSFG
jgi:hypothetical protein